jgi:hypothetical protein
MNSVLKKMSATPSIDLLILNNFKLINILQPKIPHFQRNSCGYVDK